MPTSAVTMKNAPEIMQSTPRTASLIRPESTSQNPTASNTLPAMILEPLFISVRVWTNSYAG